MVINALVYAHDKEEALNLAEHIFENMVGDSHSFDYYTMFREKDDGHTVSGSDRWGKIPACMDVTSKRGKKELDGAWKATARDFKDSMSKVRKALSIFTDEELLETEYDTKKPETEEEKDKHYIRSMFRFYCRNVGQYCGSSCWLYDQDGEGIKTKKHLDDVLNKWVNLDGKVSDDLKEKKIWIVPADVHF
jgi:hypothetical protein